MPSGGLLHCTMDGWGLIRLLKNTKPLSIDHTYCLLIMIYDEETRLARFNRGCFLAIKSRVAPRVQALLTIIHAGYRNFHLDRQPMKKGKKVFVSRGLSAVMLNFCGQADWLPALNS